MIIALMYLIVCLIILGITILFYKEAEETWIKILTILIFGGTLVVLILIPFEFL